MSSYESNDVLNRLLVIHHRSLAQYLRDAPPWMQSTSRAAEAKEVLTAIADEDQRIVDELGELLTDRNWPIQYGEYPISFTAYHDLSLDFLLSRLIENQRRDIGRIEQCIAQLERDAVGRAIAERALAERALGAAKAHLEMLQSVKKPKPASAA